jgi:alcohol dehydrogenase
LATGCSSRVEAARAAGLVDTYTTPTLLRLVMSQQLDAGRFVTHHFGLDQFEEAYDVFGRAGDTGALKSS